VRLEVTRRADLAVRAMIVLGDTPADERLKGPALAAALGTTPAFVAQVMGPLVKAGWVRSDPGPLGGYARRVALDEVSVLDVIEAVDGATDAGRCVVENRACDPTTPCVLHDAWGQARDELTRTLDATPLSALGRVAAPHPGVVARGRGARPGPSRRAPGHPSEQELPR
jgi:Rrf2 family protein